MPAKKKKEISFLGNPVVKEKKKAPPLRIHHTVFEVIKVLSAMGILGEYALWRYAGAIRGPDCENECAKDISTAIIRGESSNGNDIRFTQVRTFPSEKAFNVMFANGAPTGHFRSHMTSGFTALAVYYRKIGNTQAAAIFDGMSSALGTRDYKRYKAYVKKVVDHWQFTR